MEFFYETLSEFVFPFVIKELYLTVVLDPISMISIHEFDYPTEETSYIKFNLSS